MSDAVRIRCPRGVSPLPAIGACLVIVLGCGADAQESADPFPRELRRRVEAMKRELDEHPTTAANVEDRTALLWTWANAYALAGGALPVNLPSRVSAVAAARFDGEPAPAPLVRDIDRYLRELALKDDEPGALGRVRFATGGPLVAGSWVTIEEIYELGTRALEPGAAILLGGELVTDHGLLQNEDPGGDHFVGIRSSKGDVRFAPIRVPLPGIHGRQGGGAGVVGFALREGRLESGDVVTVTIGDRGGGSRGFQVQTWSIDNLHLPLYVSFDGELFLTPHWPALEVVGLPEVRSLRVTVPSIVEPGERFELAVRSQDSFLNRTTAETPAYEVLLDGQRWASIAAGAGAVSVVEGGVTAPGVHRFTVRSIDGGVAGRSNPVRVVADPKLRLYWGETHGHTALAEGQGSAEAYFRFGLEDARLDFVTLSEHDALMDDAEWESLRRLSRAYNQEGRYLTFLGYEWSAQRRQGGHHNVLFRTVEGRDRVGVQTANDLGLLYEGLRGANRTDDVLVIPHAHQAGDWNRSDAELERLVEIDSVHGVFEWFGNLYLRNGFEVGFIAASDDHRARPGSVAPLPVPFKTQRGGMAGVWASGKTGKSVFAALRARSAYATSGERILLDVELNGFPMGTRQPDAEKRRIECRVAGTAPIDRIHVVKNGEVVHSASYLAAPLGRHAFVQVGFYSSSEVFPPERDNPRASRAWRGELAVEGARLIGIRTPGFDNLYSESAAIDRDDAQRLRFATETRGRLDSLLLELEEAGPETRLLIDLEPSRLTGNPQDMATGPQVDIPGGRIELALSDLVDGRLERSVAVGPHADRIVVQVIDPDAPLDRDFEWSDLAHGGAGGGGLGEAANGDYYYVRVDQLDGAQAWSSPFWVGERRPSPKEGPGS